MAFSVKTTAFEAGGVIPKKHTCDGPDLSFGLEWSEAPASTKSFAIIFDDPDAPVGNWVHWVVFDIPSNVTQLSEEIPLSETLPNGAKQGLNDFRRVGYGGPCPPKGLAHRYFLKLYALDTLLNLPPKTTKSSLEKAMQSHILGQTQLMGKYGR